jgi:cytochrome c biogenesis protein CcmG, thiol:disulfide interchange protein DsbE
MQFEPGFAPDRRALCTSLAALGITGLGGMFASDAGARALRLGAPAPPAVLVTLDGTRIATADLIGRVVMLTFWATWCAPCRQELPLLSSCATKYSARGLTILGFALDERDDLPKVRKMAQAFAFPSGLVADSSLPGYGRIWRIPVNFTIDRKGLLVQDGWADKDATWTEERFNRLIAPLLS